MRACSDPLLTAPDRLEALGAGHGVEGVAAVSASQLGDDVTNVVAQVNALLFLEFFGEIIDDSFIEIFSAKEGIAIGRFHLEDAIADPVSKTW